MQLKYVLLSLGLTIFLAGCNDARQVDPLTRALESGGFVSRVTNSVLTPKISIQYDGKATATQKMLIHGSQLILSGHPFGFSNWDVGSNPLNPRLQFAYAININSFSPFPSWLPDYYASGAMAAMGRYVVSSGAAGTSLIDIGIPDSSRELRRYPERKLTDTQVPRDEDYVYRAIITHPTEPYFFGFREQDFVTSLKIDGNGLNLTKKTAYARNGDKGTCCVLGGATFKGAAYVGFRSSVRKYVFETDGVIKEGGVYNNINGTNIVATNDYLYVQHQAIPGNTLASGIYVIDGTGNSVMYLPIVPVAFAVSPDNRYLYANIDNTNVTVFQINWGY
ncbi:MAG: hypothetical protein EBR01_06270 [Proteobacteria bacterium]|nr:hypothetical protein [Pseudomonadota bacterium]NBY20313.1 hypothetical protein [bacterium]